MNNNTLELYLPKVISEIKGFAIFILDKEGVISTWNTGCEQLKEYKPEEVIGQFYGILFPDFLREKGDPELELKEAEIKGRYEKESWRRKKSGELFWAYLVLTRITDDDGNIIGFVKITQDLSEKKKYQDDLKSKNQELIRINKDLDNFVFTASHDLKAPINNIGGLITALEDILKTNYNAGEEILTITSFLKQSVVKFKEIISEMASTGKEEVENQKVYQSFPEIFKDVKENLGKEIKDSGAEIHADFSQVPTVRFSSKNLRSILHNLISNSIKYRHPERIPKILIQTRIEEGYTVLEVSDNGKGIKEEDKKRVFLMYNRLEEGNQNVEGTGVGLAIVSRIVDANGGKIELNSTPGVGSQFKIYI